MGSINLSGYGAANWRATVDTVFDLPALDNVIGDVRAVYATANIYIWDGAAWNIINSGGSTGTVTSVGLVDNTGTLTISGSPVTSAGNLTITAFKSADTTHTGLLTSTDWNTFNSKQPAGSYVPTTRNVNTSAPLSGGGNLSADLTLSIPVATSSVNGYLSSTDWTTFNSKQPSGSYALQATAINTTSPLTGGGNLSTSRTLSIPAATTSVDGYLTATDWNTFNNKQPSGSYVPTTRTISTTSPLTGGGDLSTNRTFTIPAATTSVNGYLTSTDWTAFNGKQAAGNYITALTGDVTASGPGLVAATISNLAVTNAKIANTTIDLTTKVTGVLPIANGGTGTSTTFTVGSVVFAKASGIYGQDNSKLFWDDTNFRLGVNIATPGAGLQVNTSAAAAKGIILKGFASQSANLLEVQNSSATVLANVNAAGNWGLIVPTTNIATLGINFPTGVPNSSSMIDMTQASISNYLTNSALNINLATDATAYPSIIGQLYGTTSVLRVSKAMTSSSGSVAVYGRTNSVGLDPTINTANTGITYTSESDYSVNTPQYTIAGSTNGLVMTNAAYDAFLQPTTTHSSSGTNTSTYTLYNGFLPHSYGRGTDSATNGTHTFTDYGVKLLIQGITGAHFSGTSYGLYVSASGSATNYDIYAYSGSNNYLAGALGLNQTTPAASAQLDIVSTTKGVLFPRMTTTQKNAISSPATGLMVYDTTLNKLALFTGTVWETVTSI